MKDTTKNTITNLLSIPCMIGVVYEYANDKDWKFMVGFFTIGLALLLFKASKTKEFIERFINNFIKE